MKCPHCNHTINSNPKYTAFTYDKDCHWRVVHEQCPECLKVIIYISRGKRARDAFTEINRYLVYPRTGGRTQAPIEVPQHIAEDYNEAGLILNDSPKASAALGRKCLQTIIHEHFEIKENNLNLEIDKVMKIIPSYIAEDIDAIRTVGNFEAHPIKSESAGKIAKVEEGEAEWILEVLEQLFDICYVQPKISADKRAKLNAKLQDSGKPLLKK